MHIVVSELIAEAALSQIGSDATFDYNPELVENRPRLLHSIHKSTGLIVRNRTQVNTELLAAAPTTLISMPALPALSQCIPQLVPTRCQWPSMSSQPV